MLTIEDTILSVADAQGRLARVVAESETAIERLCILVKGAKLLGVPTLLTAQAPEKWAHHLGNCKLATRAGRSATYELQHLA